MRNILKNPYAAYLSGVIDKEKYEEYLQETVNPDEIDLRKKEIEKTLRRMEETIGLIEKEEEAETTKEHRIEKPDAYIFKYIMMPEYTLDIIRNFIKQTRPDVCFDDMENLNTNFGIYNEENDMFLTMIDAEYGYLSDAGDSMCWYEYIIIRDGSIYTATLERCMTKEQIGELSVLLDTEMHAQGSYAGIDFGLIRQAINVYEDRQKRKEFLYECAQQTM